MSRGSAGPPSCCAGRALRPGQKAGIVTILEGNVTALLLLSVASTLNYQGRLVSASNGGQIIETHPTSDFVSISGGNHAIATLAAFPGMFGLFGRSTNTVLDTDPLITTLGSITVGTDQPLQRSGAGAFLNLSNGAALSTQQAVFLDTALLSASAPLLEMSGSSTMTTAGNAINLNQKAKLASIGPLLKINGSALTVNGSAFRLGGGSGLAVTGDLLSISGGGSLNINNGGALFVSGGSIVNITGALVNFGAGGGALNITNNFCSGNICTVFTAANFASFTVASQPGATIVITPSGTQIVKGAGALTCPGSCAAVFVDSTSKLKILGSP